MTLKEKAQELFDKMFLVVENKGMYDDLYRAKQCALIAVDEIIEAVRNAYDHELLGIQILYWEKLKQEIEKL